MMIAAAALATGQQVFKYPQGGTGSPGPYPPGSEICSDGSKFIPCDATATPTVTATLTVTPTASATATPTNTPTNTPTDTPSNTPSDTPTATPTSTSTNTPTVTPTSTPTPTVTNTPIVNTVLNDSLWGRRFWEVNSLLPTTNAISAATSIPAFDYTAISAGHVMTTDLATVHDVLTSAAGSTVGREGWDLGAGKSVVLFAVGGMGAGGSSAVVTALHLCQDVPTVGSGPPKCYKIQFKPQNNGFSLDVTSAVGTGTVLATYGSATLLTAPSIADVPPLSAAILFDGSAHTLTGWIRSRNSQWFKILSASDSTYSTMRYVGISAENSSGVTISHDAWFVAPFQVWYTP